MEKRSTQNSIHTSQTLFGWLVAHAALGGFLFGLSGKLSVSQTLSTSPFSISLHLPESRAGDGWRWLGHGWCASFVFCWAISWVGKTTFWMFSGFLIFAFSFRTLPLAELFGFLTLLPDLSVGVAMGIGFKSSSPLYIDSRVCSPEKRGMFGTIKSAFGLMIGVLLAQLTNLAIPSLDTELLTMQVWKWIAASWSGQFGGDDGLEQRLVPALLFFEFDVFGRLKAATMACEK